MLHADSDFIYHAISDIRRNCFGSKQPNDIDVYMDSLQDALKHGKRSAKVRVIDGVQE